MSLRDDLDLILSEAEPSRYSHVAVSKFNDAVFRLRAALTPAAEKWLEALPELLELDAQVELTGTVAEYMNAKNKLYTAMSYALAAAALHNAQDNKEQK